MSGYVLANYSLARRWGVTETECNQPPPRLRFGNIPGNSVSKAETAIKLLIWQAAWQNAWHPHRPLMISTRSQFGNRSGPSIKLLSLIFTTLFLVLFASRLTIIPRMFTFAPMILA